MKFRMFRLKKKSGNIFLPLKRIAIENLELYGKIIKVWGGWTGLETG